jgi:ABC-type multidrug transport system ATPase subunit
MARKIIEIRNLRKSYQDKIALRDVNFSIKKGIIHGFIGPNGAGKTTVIKILMGSTKPNSGEIWLLEKKIGKNNHINQKIGFMTENLRFAKDLTVEEFCQLTAKLRNIPLWKSENRLKNSDLTAFRYKKCRDLSTGWKKILLYFTSTMHDPEILILDEPTSGLDPSYRSILLKQLEKFRGRGGTVLVSSHILSDLQKLADEITMIREGEIVYSGPKTDDIEESYEKLIAKKQVREEKEQQIWI